MVIGYDTDDFEARERLERIDEQFVFYKYYCEDTLDDLKVTMPGTVREQKRNAIKFIMDHFYDCVWSILPFDDKKDIIELLNEYGSVMDWLLDEYINKDGADNIRRANTGGWGSAYYKSDWHLYLENSDIFEVNYDIIETRGYSQGDYNEVIYVIQDNWTPKDINLVNQNIHNLLYACPVYGCITIDDRDYYIHNYLNNQYKWDKDDFIKQFKIQESDNISPEAMDELIEILPTELEYV